jgi:hypothetical protein
VAGEGSRDETEVEVKHKPTVVRQETIREDEVTEAGLESFPASDPPAFNQTGPKDHAPTPAGDPNTAQLRSQIPSGRTMGRSSAHEPAAAPFDTDDEAAGRPASAVAVRTALANEGRTAERVPPALEERGRETARWASIVPRAVLIVVLAAAALWLLFG